jgi:hypothetical protein
MKDQAQKVWEAYEEEDTYNFPKDGVSAALREVVMEVVLPYMQYAEWEIVHKIMEDINKVADEIETL